MHEMLLQRLSTVHDKVGFFLVISFCFANSFYDYYLFAIQIDIYSILCFFF